MCNIGDIAVCETNIVGLITQKTFKVVNGCKRTLYKGIKLEGEIGKPWQSFNPRVLTNIEEIVLNLRQLGNIYKPA